jgi:chaperone modulatory protein CbpM
MTNETNSLLVDVAGLTVDELASACAVSCEWVEQHVREGFLAGEGRQAGIRFTSVHLLRARRLRDIERMFDANEELAALVVDLIEEVERRRKIGV